MAAAHTSLPGLSSHDIHIVGLVPSTVSFLATAVGVYWFWALLHAEGNFRRTLIFVLILADCSKSFWIMMFSAAGLAMNDNISSTSTFCQAGGFLLQVSLEACDLAIVMLITHVSLQILPPVRFWGSSRDGLWHIRYLVLGCCIGLPLISASVPFYRGPSQAFVYDGVTCSLPTDPAWISLALSWVPRYIAWLYLFVMVIYLYLYIRSQSYRAQSNSISKASTKSLTLDCAKPSADATPSRPGQDRRALGLNHHILKDCDAETGSALQTSTHLRTSAHVLTIPKGHDEDSKESQGPLTLSQLHGDTLKPKRQFRAVSLYPFFYMLAWAVPFAAQCTALTPARNGDTIWNLRPASIVAVSSLGIIDTVIFCAMEKPYRFGLRLSGLKLQPYRVGNRRGSGRFGSDDEENPSAEMQAAMNTRRPYGGGSDHNRRKALQAYERLALEQAERMSQPTAKRGSLSEDLAIHGPPEVAELASPDLGVNGCTSLSGLGAASASQRPPAP